ncbi:peptide ABC transporter permease [Mangrovactinospora gilvigrisea]|uniref:Peptide ABC transporter permease n=1 Tax=Mangrovactinospora gilvigrisea TaxID=1428644 RepID=A0A1J7BI84_9ACTN|nr:peptide ABC transporter permease [Mangrovactinospora gilvigrisea]
MSRIARSYVLRRIVRSLFVIWFVTTCVFFLVRLMPGNPVEAYINKLISAQGMSYDSAQAQASSLFSFDPRTPLINQYWSYLVGVAHLNFGNSILSPGTTVLTKIGSHLPYTLFSVGYALIISIIIGLLLGMLMAYRRGGVVDHVMSAVGSTLHAIPNYLFAIMFLVFGGIQLGLFDFASLRGTHTDGINPSFSITFLSDVMYHAALPVTIYVLTTFGTWALIMKASTTQALEEDFVMVARARGLSGARIGAMYVGRNAVLPLVAQIAVQAGFVVGGAIFVELILGYEGVGQLLYDAVNGRDYPVIQGILLIITISVVGANLIADLCYGILDPRIRDKGVEE